jgi:hypothetical protein
VNYALSVGINKYKTPGNDLNGCVNDVTNIKNVLTSNYGFSVLGIKTLTDSQATKQAIMTALQIMINNSVKGDHLVYHHSSHGTQIQDVNGDESDGLDEVLCTYDFDWAGTYIVDDELRELFSKIKKGITLDVILDSCHSGTAIRSLECNSKFIMPVYDRPVPTHGRKSTPIIKQLLKGDLPSGVTLWAGCKPNQTSADARINGQFNGAMTYYFCEALKGGKGSSRATVYANLKKMIRMNYEQVPQLECSIVQRYKKVFA